jgi:hypothetical protein
MLFSGNRSFQLSSVLLDGKGVLLMVQKVRLISQHMTKLMALSEEVQM